MTRSRTVLVAGLLAVTLLAAGPASLARASTYRDRMFKMINRVRVRHGLRELRLNFDLSRYAHKHSRKMAEEDRLFHTRNLRRKLRSYRWTVAGENLGAAGSLKRIRKLWMKSADHRANLLLPDYRRVGVGVVRYKGWFWVTAIFYG
ncbi:MAG: CAP domain-containing protein [Actinobacteria bacterium]|nr:CAP domain-containing protein [Actinomycetota bacterium]